MFGVKRSMRGDEAKRVYPDIRQVQVPVARDKANLNLYCSAGSEVVAILSTKGKCERVSIDEAYLDLTDGAKSVLLEAPPEVLNSIPGEAIKSHILGLSSGAILRYFPGCSSSNVRSGNDIAIEEQERMDRSITSERSLNPNLNDNAISNDNWGFSIEEIDPSVVDELPLEIQQEIRGWIHPIKRRNTAKRRSSIASYFTPARK